MIDNLHFVKELGLRSKAALEGGDVEGFAELMHEHWVHKKKRSSVDVQHRHRPLVRAGPGATARSAASWSAPARGGFLLFYTRDPRRLRKAMAGEGLAEVRFAFDNDGSTVLVRD